MLPNQKNYYTSKICQQTNKNNDSVMFQPFIETWMPSYFYSCYDRFEFFFNGLQSVIAQHYKIF